MSKREAEIILSTKWVNNEKRVRSEEREEWGDELKKEKCRGKQNATNANTMQMEIFHNPHSRIDKRRKLKRRMGWIWNALLLMLLHLLLLLLLHLLFMTSSGSLGSSMYTVQDHKYLLRPWRSRTETIHEPNEHSECDVFNVVCFSVYSLLFVIA